MATLETVSWPVRTDRLLIRRAQESDVAALWRFRQREDVARWMSTLPATYEQHVARHQEPGRLDKTLIVELDGEVIGDLMLTLENAWAQTEVAEQAKDVQAELGWCIDPEYGGQGYGTEAVEALLRICFDDLRLRRVTANCFAANAPSWRLMERVGMRRELHTVRESLHRSGEWLDGFGYALLADEWRGRHATAGDLEGPLASERS